MEATILETLKTLGPLKTYNVHKWLIKKKASLRQVERSINNLVAKGRLRIINGYCLLPNQVIKETDASNKYLIRLEAMIAQLKPSNRLALLDYSGAVVIKDKDSLSIGDRTIRNAYRLLKLKPIWQRGDYYHKLLDENSWVFKYFPNWTSGIFN